MKSPILGSSYVARSVNAADNRMVNLYPEIVPEGGKEPAFLQRAPALTFLATVGTGPINGLYSFTTAAGVPWLLTVSGQQLYVSVSGGVATLVGTVLAQGPVCFADNGVQVFITTGIDASPQRSYIYNTTTLVLAQITDADFPGADTVTYIDGFFVFNQPRSQKIWCSDLLDGTSVQPLNFASAEASPDGAVAVIADHKELWVFGRYSTEVWYNAGNAGFPFAPIQGAYNEVGCSSPNTIAKLDNTIFWLGQDTLGHAIVYKANGYRAERVSNHAIEWYLRNYLIFNPTLNLRAYSYQQNGHSFYVLWFPTGTSWVYDTATQVWHERASNASGDFTTYKAGCAAFQNRLTFVGDYSSNNVYYLTNTITDEVKWLRSWRALPPGANNLNRTAHHSLQLDIEAGVGNASAPGNDPSVALRWSDDGGHTWSTGSSVKIGVAAEYGKRVIWRRLGMTMKLRDRVYEISSSDPVSIFIMGAELHMSPTNA